MRPHTALIMLGVAIIAFVCGVELGARTPPASGPALARMPAPPAASGVGLVPDGPARRGTVVEKIAVINPVDPEAVEGAVPVSVEAALASMVEVASPASEAQVVQPVATLELPEGQPAKEANVTVAHAALKAAGVEPPVAPVAPTPPRPPGVVEVQPASEVVTALTQRIPDPQPIMLETARVRRPVAPHARAVAPPIAPIFREKPASSRRTSAATPRTSTPTRPAPVPAKYVVQVISVRDRGEANQRVRLLAGQGVPAFVESADLGSKGTWYRVLAGTFSSKAAAKASLEKLQADPQFGASFVRPY